MLGGHAYGQDATRSLIQAEPLVYLSLSQCMHVPLLIPRYIQVHHALPLPS